MLTFVFSIVPNQQVPKPTAFALALQNAGQLRNDALQLRKKIMGLKADQLPVFSQAWWSNLNILLNDPVSI